MSDPGKFGTISESSHSLAALVATHSSSVGPTRSPSPGGDDQDSDDEMDRLMCSSPIPEDTEPGGTTGTAGEEVNRVSPASQDDVDGNLLQLSGIARNEQTLIRRAAERLKIHPYQRVFVNDFAKV